MPHVAGALAPHGDLPLNGWDSRPARDPRRRVAITRNPEARVARRSGVRPPDRDLHRRAVAPRVPAAERPAGARFDARYGGAPGRNGGEARRGCFPRRRTVRACDPVIDRKILGLAVGTENV